MEYQEFLNRTQQASKALQAGRLKEAEEQFYQLFLSSISDLDKAVICSRLAETYDRMGRTDDAFSWYDKGIDLEQMYSRYEVTEKKAAYLALMGRNKDATTLYETLIKQPFITEAERERMRKIIQTLIGQSMRQWQ